MYEAASSSSDDVHNIVSYRTFCCLWQKLLPSVIMRPMSDLWNSTLRSANVPESEKREKLKKAMDHLNVVSEERPFYRSISKESQKSILYSCAWNDSLVLQSLSWAQPSNSRNIKVHYYFDYAQMVWYAVIATMSLYINVMQFNSTFLVFKSNIFLDFIVLSLFYRFTTLLSNAAWAYAFLDTQKMLYFWSILRRDRKISQLSHRWSHWLWEGCQCSHLSAQPFFQQPQLWNAVMDKNHTWSFVVKIILSTSDPRFGRRS